jgi:hypothetical protein
MVPRAGLEPAAFGCLRHRKVRTSYDCLVGCPMSPTRYQLRHLGLVRGGSIDSLNHTDEIPT